jgi:hypothetical protein
MSAMSQNIITCILCERTVPSEDLPRSHRPRYFDDVVICPSCLDGDRYGYGDNGAAVRRCLETRGAAGERPPGERRTPGS